MQLSLLKRHKFSMPIIKLTPLIDVLFILLIFAMLVTDHQNFRQIDLSVGTYGNHDNQIDLDELIIHIGIDGELFLENKRSTLSTILESIKHKQEKRPNVSILLSSLAVAKYIVLTINFRNDSFLLSLFIAI